MRIRLTLLSAAFGAALASAGTAGAATFYLSTQGGNTLDGLSFRGGDIVQYDDSPPGTAALFFDEDDFDVPGPGPEVDAFELLDDGRMLFSTNSVATLGSNSIDIVNGDIVEYDPATDLATLIFDEQTNFQGQADVDAVAILPNGNILFSTVDDADLDLGPGPGLGILDGDVIEWDPLTNSFVGVYLSETAFFGGVDVDIDAFDVTPDGASYALSLENDANVLGLTVLDGDLVRYDIDTDTAIVWLSESLFTGAATSPLDAVAVPEPGAPTLFALGLLGLALAGRRRPR
jgi:hypothetical protein